MKTTRTTCAALAGLALLAAPVATHAASYAKTATVTAPGVPADVTLSDFPLLVRLSTAISGFDYGDFQGTDGSDLRFEDASGNALAYEVDTWNPQGESLVWVKVPSLTAATEITMRWGSANPDANDPAAVWSNYVGVWHGNDWSCATGGDYPASPLPAADGYTLSTARAAHLGSAFFNANTAQGTRFKLGTRDKNPLAALASVSQLTVSAWVKSAIATPSVRFFSNKVAYSDNGFELLAVSGSGFLLRGNGTSAQAGWWTGGYQDLKSQNWTHIAATIDGSAGTMFVNGATYSGTVAAPTAVGDQGVAFGGYSADTNKYSPLTGFADEIRIYNGVPAAAYLVAEHAQVVTSGYVVVGAVGDTAQDVPDIAAAPTVVRNANGTYTLGASVTGIAGYAYNLEIQLNDTAAWTDVWTPAAGSETRTVSWTTDANVADGTYQAVFLATAPSGASARRAADEVFLVGDVSAAKGADAYEEGLVAGSFVLSRPGDATLPLTVAYAVSSVTATAGTSYRAPSGTATFAAGASTATVVLEPLNDPYLTADAAIELALSAGSFYGVSATAGTASLTLVDYAPPAGYNVWVAAYDGNASAAANWSLGRAPVAEDHILLGAWSARNLTWDAAATNRVASWTQNADYAGQVIFPITYAGADVDEGFNLFTAAGDVTLLGGAWVHPVQGPSSIRGPDPAERYRIAVEAGGDFTVGAGVNVSALGRGRGFWVVDDEYARNNRGIHAGYVITRTNEMYAAVTNPLFIPFGSILEPVATGRGSSTGTDSPTSSGHGGGAIHLVVGGALVNNGRIVADGQAPTGNTGGAGGSVFVRAASISGSGTFEADATCATGSGQYSASSGGRVSLVATGANAATADNASARGSRSPDWWQRENQPYWEGAAGTVWLQSGSSRTLVVRNNYQDGLGPYIRAYTPIPADDANFRASSSRAMLDASDNARIRLVSRLRFETLRVKTADGAAHIDLNGNLLAVQQAFDSAGALPGGTYTLADARARGWTWLEDSSNGAGKLVVGDQATVILLR